jgi:hypothetical protein
VRAGAVTAVAGAERSALVGELERALKAYLTTLEEPATAGS